MHTTPIDLALAKLPTRWQGRARFVVLEAGFGLGEHFLATWAAWRQDPQRCGQLHCLAVERRPLTRDALRAAHADSPLADALIDAWPPLTPNLHRLTFDGGRVQLLLALGDVADLGEIDARVDAFFLNAGSVDVIAPQHLGKALARLAAPEATVVSLNTSSALRAGLVASGFALDATAGTSDITQAHYAPRFVPKRSPGRPHHAASNTRHAVIVGAGLAGCAAAWALAEQGWRCTLIDRHDRPANETSGNPAGLFHGIVNAQDGLHARFNRAASFEAARAVHEAITTDGAAGAVQGLLRLETSGQTAEAMRETLAHLGLPSDYAQALDAEAASSVSGIALTTPAWFFPQGGWVQPSGLAHSFLRRAGASVEWRGNTEVSRMERGPQGWRVFDAHGALLCESEVVVLANAHDALRLAPSGHGWLSERLRGQISTMPASALPCTLPRVPVAGSGYLLPDVTGLAIFGATTQRADDDPAVREADHLDNLRQLGRLTGYNIARPDGITGRVGWRWSTDDRLPLIGAVPDATQLNHLSRTPDQPRFVPRVPGLFVLGALGSRGITWCALGAQVLASAISGAPSPVEARLLDAIDPGRFICRAVRRPQPPGAAQGQDA